MPAGDRRRFCWWKAYSPLPVRRHTGFNFSRHCERSEAIHSFFARRDGLLRGACHRARIRATRWLAMTVHKYDSAISPRIAPEPLKILPPKRGRRERRVLAAPAVSRAKVHKENAHEHTGTVGAFRRSPHNGFTAYAALSSATNSSCHRRRRISSFAQARLGSKNLRRLDTSNGCQDHTVLPYATTPFVCRAVIAHRLKACPAIAKRARRCRVHRIPSQRN
jgi:hypothetical protein